MAANESRSALTSTSESNVRSARAASVAASTDSFAVSFDRICRGRKNIFDKIYFSGVQWLLWPPDGLNHAETGAAIFTLQNA